MYNISAFCFVEETQKFAITEEDLVTRLSANFEDEKQLFDLLTRELHLPDYFGGNWDAFDELLHDFWWVSQKRIIMIHDDLPFE